MNGSSSAVVRGFRLAALVAAVICVLAAAGGAFAVSYPGVRDTVVAAGAGTGLARFYPLVFDAVFVVACVAALMLRGLLRGYAWLVIVIIAGAVAAADATHAMSATLAKRPMEATVAVVPWVALLVGLTLLYAMTRQGLPARRTAAAGSVPANGSAAAEERPAAAGTGWPGSRHEQAISTAVPLSALLAGRATAPASIAGAGTTALTVPAGAVGTLPEPVPAGHAMERDDPSDADAGPADPPGAPPGPGPAAPPAG